jgi:hypothetical protein
VAGAAVGILGNAFIGAGTTGGTIGAVLSAALIIYAAIGSAAAAYLERHFDRSAGLAVPIVVRSDASDKLLQRAATYAGPYAVEPEVTVVNRSGRATTELAVHVVDREGRLVKTLSSRPVHEGWEPEIEAAVLMSQADELVVELETKELVASKILPPRSSDGGPENGV